MWTETDEYLDGVWNRYQRALKLIEQFKESPVEDIRFIAEYLDELIKDNFREQTENTKKFKVINLLKAQRDDYIQYSEWLEKEINMAKNEIKRLGGKYEYYGRVEYKKEKIFNYDYDKRYHEKELELNWTHLWRD